MTHAKRKTRHCVLSYIQVDSEETGGMHGTRSVQLLYCLGACAQVLHGSSSAEKEDTWDTYSDLSGCTFPNSTAARVARFRELVRFTPQGFIRI